MDTRLSVANEEMTDAKAIDSLNKESTKDLIRLQVQLKNSGQENQTTASIAKELSSISEELVQRKMRVMSHLEEDVDLSWMKPVTQKDKVTHP